MCASEHAEQGVAGFVAGGQLPLLGRHMLQACTARICRRPRWSGADIVTRRSKRVSKNVQGAST